MRTILNTGLAAIVGARTLVGAEAADPWQMPSKPWTQDEIRDELAKTGVTTLMLGFGMMLFSEEHKRAGAFLSRLSMIFLVPAGVVAAIPPQDWPGDKPQAQAPAPVLPPSTPKATP